MFSDPKETIRALHVRQERRRLNASSVSSSPCPEPSCEQRDPLISGENVGGTKLRALKPISRTSHQFAPNSASSRLQVTTHFLHASPLSLRSRASPLRSGAAPRLSRSGAAPRLSRTSRASPLSLRSRASPLSIRSRASPLSLRSHASLLSLQAGVRVSAASRLTFLAEPRLALLAPERRLASLATPRSGAASRLTRRSFSLARSDRFFKYLCPLCWNFVS